MGWRDDDALTGRGPDQFRVVDIRREEPIPVPPKVFHGLELHGLLALMVLRIDVEREYGLVRGLSIVPQEIFAVHVVWQVPSVQGGDWIQLEFHSREVTHRRWMTDAQGRQLLPAQGAIRQALDGLWRHEWDEALAIDGLPLEQPEDIHR